MFGPSEPSIASPVCQAHHMRPPGVTAMVGSPCHFLSLSAYVSVVPSAIGRSVTPSSVDQNPTTGASSAACAAICETAGAQSAAAMTAARITLHFFMILLRQ